MTNKDENSYLTLGQVKQELDNITGFSDKLADERTKLRLSELKENYDSLKNRGQSLANALQKAVPFSALPGEHSVAQQEELLLAITDFRLLQKLFETAKATFNSINLDQLSPDDIETGSFVETLAGLAQEMVDAVVAQIGVSKEAVMPSVIRDFERQLETIKVVFERAEESLKTATA